MNIENSINNAIIEKRRNMINIMSQNEEFIIIGLTGKTGSGCSEAARILASDYSELELPLIQPGSNGFASDSEREKRILERYASSHWLKFDIIRTRSVITFYLMDKIKDFIVAFNKAKKASQDEKNYDLNHQECTLETLFPSIKSTQKNKVEWNTEFKAIIQEINRMLVNMKQQSILENQNITAIINCDSFDDTQINNCANATNEFKKYYHLSEDSDNGFARYDRGRFIPKLEAAISHISCLAMSCILSIGQDTEAVFSEIMEIKDTIDNSSLVGEETNESYTKKYKRFVLIHDILPLLCDDLHDYLKKNSNFTQLFQKYGNCIRKCGKIVFDDKIHEDENEKK